MITDDNERGQAATSGRNTTDLERRRASSYVCRSARDRNDAVELPLWDCCPRTSRGPPLALTDPGRRSPTRQEDRDEVP